MRAALFAIVLLMVSACTGAGGVREGDEERAAETNVQLAVGYLQQGRLELAKTKIDKALSIDPEHPGAHSTAALVYERLQEYKIADEHYRKALKLRPKDGVMYNNYGVFLCNQERYAEAETQFRAALTTPRYPTPEGAYENLGVCTAKGGDLQKAEEYLRTALKLNPNLPLALHEMVRITYETGRSMNARAYLQRYAEIAAQTPQSLLLGVMLERDLGDPAASERYARQLSAQFPQSEEARKLLSLQGIEVTP